MWCNRWYTVHGRTMTLYLYNLQVGNRAEVQDVAGPVQLQMQILTGRKLSGFHNTFPSLQSLDLGDLLLLFNLKIQIWTCEMGHAVCRIWACRSAIFKRSYRIHVELVKWDMLYIEYELVIWALYTCCIHAVYTWMYIFFSICFFFFENSFCKYFWMSLSQKIKWQNRFLLETVFFIKSHFSQLCVPNRCVLGEKKLYSSDDNERTEHARKISFFSGESWDSPLSFDILYVIWPLPQNILWVLKD